MNATPNSSPGGIALLCDSEGRIIELIRDDLGLSANRDTDSFLEIVDAASRGKAENFLASISRENASFGWEMNIRAADSILPMQFTGGATSKGFLLVGALTGIALAKLTEELMSINNEQTTALRSVFKELSQKQGEQSSRDSGAWDEMSRLNNELVTLQRELAKKNRELETLNALKNTFLGMASHDLRKPLAGVQMTVELLLDDPSSPLNASQREWLDGIKASTGRVIRQLNDFLDIAQIESGRLGLRPTVGSVTSLVEARLAFHRNAASKKNIGVAFEKEPIPEFLFDSGRIEQVVDNLVENAIKYTPPGGQVGIAVRQRGASAVIEVSDTGPGMTSEQTAQLFQPFRTAGSQTTGGEKSSGVGLAIVKAILSEHGGSIEVKSEPGSGSVFTATLPIKQPSAKS